MLFPFIWVPLKCDFVNFEMTLHNFPFFGLWGDSVILWEHSEDLVVKTETIATWTTREESFIRTI